MGNRIIDLRDPDDYIPFDEYEKHEQAYKMRLQAKANELQKYVDDTLAEKSPISVRYKETIHLGVVQPHILVNNNGQFYYFTDCDKAENKVKEFVDGIMNTNTSNTVKLNEAQLRKIVAESIKMALSENESRLFQELDLLLYNAMGDGLYCGKYEGDGNWDFYECYNKWGEELKGILTKYNLI